VKAYELLDSPEKWAKGWFAYDNAGVGCYSTDKQAVSWCASGAIRKCYGYADDSSMETDEEYEAGIKLRLAIQKHPGRYTSNIAEWNDAPERTYEEVYNLLKGLDL